MWWPLQPLQPLQKTQLQPTFGPSVDPLCYPWFTTTNLSHRLPIFETSATALCGTELLNSARLPQFLNLTASKTKQFCKSSSILKVDKIKNETSLQDTLQKWTVECIADGCLQMDQTGEEHGQGKEAQTHRITPHPGCCSCFPVCSQMVWPINELLIFIVSS